MEVVLNFLVYLLKKKTTKKINKTLSSLGLVHVEGKERTILSCLSYRKN